MSLKNELEVIEQLLRDVEEKERKGEMSDTMEVWTRQIRDAASEAENVVDEYRYHLMNGRERTGFASSLGRACHVVKTVRPSLFVASKISHAKESLREIRKWGRDYGLRPLKWSGQTTLDDEGASDPRWSSLYMEEDEIVGIEPTTKDLVENLVKGPATRVVVSVVGEGGVGKTTLAKRVFDDEEVRRHFGSSRKWITVSPKYNLKKVLKKLREQFVSTRSDGEFAIDKKPKGLGQHLEVKRYFIVFDDVWDKNFWDKVQDVLPRNNEGNRVMITTRSEFVSDACKESQFDIVKTLKPWSTKLAWELFCKKAFQQSQGKSCPEELRELSTEIVEKCQGLPLVISSIASLLAKKEKKDSEWEEMLSNLNSKAEINSQVRRVHEILSLSYYDLPYFLRPCFLYFGLFPEAYSIADEQLYRLWIAEGFVKAKPHKTPEEVAAEYLGELVKRNLVVSDPSEFAGEGNWFRVHGLMHKIILSRADELGFFRTLDETTSLFRGKGRRISIYDCSTNALKNVESSKIRSLLLSDLADDELVSSFMVTELKRYKFLEVLNLENPSVDRIPREIKKFFNLKYLGLRNTEVKVLPKSICELQNLQSLDIRGSSICKLPKNITKLVNLRHLLAYTYGAYEESFDYINGVRLPEKFGSLEELQTLALVDVDASGGRAIQELEKLRKLRWLGVSKLTKENGRALCSAICEMDYLERLWVFAKDENEALDLEDLPSPPSSLQELCLLGRLERLPLWITELSKLSGVILKESRLGDEAMKSLELLHSLQVLELWTQAYEGEKLHFKEGGFLKLKRLALMELRNLKVVKIDEGALPGLENLVIQDCTLLKKMPSIQYRSHVTFVGDDSSE